MKKNNYGHVSVAVISNKKTLLLKRGISAPWKPKHYCFPGGKLNQHESFEYGAIRELYEETGISISLYDLISLKFGNIFAVCCANSPFVKLNYEHTHYEWVDSYSVSSYKTVPRVVETVEVLKQLGYIW